MGRSSRGNHAVRSLLGADCVIEKYKPYQGKDCPLSLSFQWLRAPGVELFNEVRRIEEFAGEVACPQPVARGHEQILPVHGAEPILKARCLRVSVFEYEGFRFSRRRGRYPMR